MNTDPSNPPEGDENLGAETAGSGDAFPFGQGLSERVRTLLARFRKLNDLFLGTGKDEFDEQGRRRDTSSKGYDASLLCTLIKRGVRDPAELGGALWFRPDGEARRKGAAYIEKGVRDALEFMNDQERPGIANGGEDCRLRVFDQIPKAYELVIAGVTVRLTTGELVSRSKLKRRLTEALDRVPTLPAPQKYDAFVNGLLTQAEIVPMPPEASNDPAVRAELERVIEGLQVSEEPDALDNGKAVILPRGQHEGCRAFRVKALLRAVREDFPKLTKGEACLQLRKLGYVGIQAPFEGRPRVWVRPPMNARGNTSE